MTMLLAQQVLDDPDAADYLVWLDRGIWAVLAICVLAIIAGGAALALGPHTELGRRATRLIGAGILGAITAVSLSAFTGWCYDLIVG
jgi:hypothetical protein